MTTITLTQNFLANARGLTFQDGGGVTWSFNPNTNTITAVASSSGGTVTSIGSTTLTIGGTSAVPTVDLSTTQVTNIGKGGTALQTASVVDSISGNGTAGSPLQLVGDALTPGNSFFYGTNSSGVRGWYAQPAAAPTAANPTASVGLSAVTGSASTYMRSDAAPALSQSITPTWTGLHTFNAGIVAGPWAGSSIAATGAAGQRALTIQGSTTTGQSLGFNMNAGTNSSDQVYTIRNAANTTTYATMTGDGKMTYNIALSATTVNALTLTAAATGFTIAGGTTPATLTVGANASVSGTNTGDQTIPTGANPSATIGLSAVNGSAATFMRSDGAPALGVGISPTWTGNHTFTPGSGLAIVLNGTATSQIGVFNGAAGNCYFDFKVSSSIVGRIGTGDSIIAGGASTDFGISNPNGGIVFATSGTSSARMKISSAGAVSMTGALGWNGATPPSQVTGFGTPTGATTTANFSGTAATTLQMQGAIAQILTIMKAHGMIGA